MTTVYGLKNCDTCRKALKWMTQSGLEYRFHDVRADGVDQATIARWARSVGWEALLNRRGTTWRTLPAGDRDPIDGGRAVALMHAHPALIKRPVFEFGGEVRVGFTEDVKAALAVA